jgi:2-dehydropantoate 2-reductase
MRIAVYGAGAVGGYFGARLSDGGAEVHLIARGAHLEVLRERGLTIVEPESSSDYRLSAHADPGEVGPVDVVLFCVKSYDTDEAAARLDPLIKDGTAVVSLQNGIDNEERIAAAIGWPHVLGGAAYVLAAIREPGVVTASGPRRIVFGEWAGGAPSSRVGTLLDVAQRAGVRADSAPDIQVAKWEKYTLLVAFSAMTAAVRLPIGEIRRSPAALEMLRAIMAEAWSVGSAAGVALDDDLVERQMSLLLAQDDGATASLYHDLVTGHRLEVEALQGTLVRLGRQFAVPIPFTEAAYAILQPWSIRNDTPVAERLSVPA